MKILRNEKIVRISKSESFSCLKEVFCPGTIWLLKEHKLCVEELQKLKSMIEDLHRFTLLSLIDLIGQEDLSKPLK